MGDYRLQEWKEHQLEVPREHTDENMAKSNGYQHLVGLRFRESRLDGSSEYEGNDLLEATWLIPWNTVVDLSHGAFRLAFPLKPTYSLVAEGVLFTASVLALDCTFDQEGWPTCGRADEDHYCGMDIYDTMLLLRKPGTPPEELSYPAWNNPHYSFQEWLSEELAEAEEEGGAPDWGNAELYTEVLHPLTGELYELLYFEHED